MIAAMRARLSYLIPALALGLLSYDAIASQGVRPPLIDAEIWAITYGIGAVIFLLFVTTGLQRCRQLATAFAVVPTLLRAVTYWAYDRRLTPLALALLIAFFARGHQRHRMGRR
tara:strand:+ start:573 stop:914 length:342 start_codon:yes stop_codon:yes gene_type:complete